MRRILAYLLAVTLIFGLAACSRPTAEPTSVALATRPVHMPQADANPQVNTEVDTGPTATPITVKYDSDDLDSGAGRSDVTHIKLEGDSVAVDGKGTAVNGTIVTITSAGAYSISGTLDDGQLVVETDDEETVSLILNGAHIACSTSAPIYIANAEKTVITLAEGTENSVADGETYVLADAESDEPNAAIFSKDDLTINGQGALTVEANYNHGIVSKDDLKIVSGNIAVRAVNDGIKGRDSISIKDGKINIEAGGDGLQANNDEDAGKGWIVIDGGTLDVVAALDGIQAETRLAVNGGTITISSGGGSVNSSARANWGDWGRPGRTTTNADSGNSAKGLKAGVDVTIVGGTIHIDSSDDALHSNDRLTIHSGDLVLASGDDGIHADTTVTIHGGNLTITQSYEGIESATVTINDGTIRIISSDDGINIAGGNDGSAMNGRPGQNRFTAFGSYHLYIHGGYIAIDSGGDGLDSNGSVTMTQGTVLVNGPTNNGNGPLDYMGTFEITGGLLVAAGSSGMAEAPSASSTQYSLMYNFESPQAAGTIFHIETQEGQEILTFVPAKTYQSVLLSSPDLESGETYVIYSGGHSAGTATDSLYAGGTYTPGTQVTSIKTSGAVTVAGSTRGGFPGGPGGRTRPGHP